MIRTLAAALATSTCVVALATPAAAQTREYNIPAGSLKSALDAYVRQSGRQVVYRADQVRSARSSGIRGQQSAEAALAAILAGSGFMTRVDGNLVAIVREGNASAIAERASSSVDNGQSVDGQDIVVTGTNIRGAPPASPVLVRSRSDIEGTGQTNLGEFARTLTQNYSGGQNPSVAGGGNQGGQNNINGSSTLNLRGLGADATLTLINGHRTAYDALSQGIDISAIPLAAVERVEVVTDGASALYGSDAVGGVANVILRRDFEGLETTVRGGLSTDGGLGQQQYSAVSGTRWPSGGFIGVADYAKSGAVFASQRSYTRNLDSSATLLPRLRQVSLMSAGHQDITEDLTFEFDAQYNDRKSFKAVPFLTIASAAFSGQENRPGLTAFTIAPRLRIALPGGWRLTTGGVYAGSNSNLETLRYTAGVKSGGQSRYHNRATAAEFGAEGPLFALGGGTARLALGGGFRRNTLDLYITQFSSSGASSVTGDLSARRDNFYGYAETSLPLVGATNRMPLAERMVVNAAIRYEKYPGVGDVVAPKFGLTYDPFSWLTLRTSWGKSFKAQTLYQEFQPRQVAVLPSSFFSGGLANRTVILLAGGNLDLKPERATTWTSGIIVRPTTGFSIEASYFDIRYKDRIASPVTSTLNGLIDPLAAAYVIQSPSLQQVAAAVATATNGISNQTGGPFDPATVQGIIDTSLLNVSSQRVRGVDVTLDYRVELGEDGALHLSSNASYLESNQLLSPGQPTTQLAGLIFAPPHFRARGGASWQTSVFTLSTFANYIGGTRDKRFATAARVDDFTSFDVTARFRNSAASGMLQNFEAILALTNVLNEKPATIRNSNPADPPYDSTNYPASGRVISLTLRKAW